MSQTRLLSSVEVTINEALKRLTEIGGLEKKSLESEFKEWIDAIQSDEKAYDVLYINKIELD
mgnify:CR=1 FL=1